MCDNGIVSLSYDKIAGACAASKVKMLACTSCERRYINAQCFKVMRTPFLMYWCKLENVVVSFGLFQVGTCLEFPALKGAENC
jgi:hypothetical protein